MKITKPVILGVVAGLALSTVAAVTPASADPVSNSLVLVGSDTLQDVTNALVNGTTVTGSSVRSVTASGATMGSFNAFPTGSLIQVKPAGPYFTRPSGSSSGRKALAASILGNTDPNGTTGTSMTNQVDIARSSSNWGSNADADNGKLLYVPFGRDAIAYAYRASTSAQETVLSHLTTAQLTAIYSAATPTVVSGVTVRPVLPQSGSGTRSTFLSDIGVTTVGTAVRSDSTVAENDATQLSTDGEIIPFSAASWIAQFNGVAPSTLAAATSVHLGSPLAVAAYTGTSTLAPNATYYADGTWGRDTYLIVEYDRVNPSSAKYDATLAAAIDPSRTKSLANFGTAPATSGAVKARFGFSTPSTFTATRAYANLANA